MVGKSRILEVTDCAMMVPLAVVDWLELERHPELRDMAWQYCRTTSCWAGFIFWWYTLVCWLVTHTSTTYFIRLKDLLHFHVR